MARKASKPAVLDESDIAPVVKSELVRPVRAEDLPYKGVDSNSMRVPASPSHTPYSA